MANPKHRWREAHAVTDEEQIARYVYLLDAVPRSVAERAHAAALAQLSAAQRRELLERLRPRLSEPAGIDADDPEALGALVTGPQMRDEMTRTQNAAAVAAPFVESAAVAGYFTVGAGSVTIDQQPRWLQELVDHEPDPIDEATAHHRQGVDAGDWLA